VAISADESPPKGLLNIDLSSAVQLSPRNFMPLTRTPWAGNALAKGIKRRQAESPNQRIGESWELSCDPEAHSRLEHITDVTLADLIACRTSECLSGSMVASGRTACDILVKLINPSRPLSLQIHPSDDNKFLKPSECGKPESWLVLDAEPGAGLYIGFSQPIEPEDLRGRLEAGSFSSDLLQFVPVKPGDYFEIRPHVPHAIGAGVVLLEPQRVIAGKSGKTWRIWDWNRKYNLQGQEDRENGKPRELHITESMSLLEPKSQTGLSYVDKLRRESTETKPAAGVTVKIYPANDWYQVMLIEMDSRSKIKLSPKIAFAGVFILAGEISSTSQFGRPVKMGEGETYFIPSTALPNTFANGNEKTNLALVIPAGKGVPSHGGNIFQ